jgi:hypothetical protein
MRTPRSVFAGLTVAALAFVTLGVGAAPVGAKNSIPGSASCSVGAATMSFSPGLQDRHYIEGRTNGRGPSATTLSAPLTDCTDPSMPAVPTGIDHGTMSGVGRVGGSHCDTLGHLKLTTTITWMRADDSVVGTTIAKLAFTIAKPGFELPWTFHFAGTARGSSSVFARNAVSFSLVTTHDNFLITAECFKTELDGLGFEPATFASAPPV